MSALVPLEVARSAGRFVGRLAFRMNTQTVRVVRRNIQLAYPRLAIDQQDALTRETVLEQGALTAELGHVWRRSSAYVMSKLTVVGIEHLEAAAADEIAKEELVTSIDAALSSSNNSSLSALTSERTEATIDFTTRAS